jgi:succinate dehydrogenase/fumarate reductase flavoprotein subunit
MRGSAWREGEFDVVVAGGGGAGLMASIEAAEAGARVLLAEKQPELGGATSMSVGSITAAGTAWQRHAGIEDSVDAHFEDLCKGIEAAAKAGQEYDRDLSRLMCEIAPVALERLAGLGLRFSGPHPEPPHSVYRMHNVVPDSSAFIDVLCRAAIDRGVVIQTSAAIRAAHRSEAGAVSGVTIEHDGESRVIDIRKALVLAAGDFSANDELARTHGRPPEVSATEPIRPYATGDGITAAMAIGAQGVALQRSGGPGFRTVERPHIAPDRGLLVGGAILVNGAGRRFCNELRNAAVAANSQPERLAWLIFDAQVASRIATAADDSSPNSRDGWYRKRKLFVSTFPGVAYAYLDDLRTTSYFFEAASIEGLAGSPGLPKDALVNEVATYNRVRRGDADAFGREKVAAGPTDPPFYAIGPIKPYNVFSGGGLAVDREVHVLDAQGRPIPRLYAAGANAEAAVYLGGHGHHLAWVFGTGQIAGRNAASEAPA